MQYMLLIYEREADWNAFGEKERNAIVHEYTAFTQGLMQSGNHRASQALQPVSTATTVRVRDGKTITTDGPFAETREQLGGMLVFECADLDEAIHWASRIPDASNGGGGPGGPLW